MPAEILQRAGFRTGGIWRNGWIGGHFGFAQGFDMYFRPGPSRGPEKYERRNPSAHPLQGTDFDATESAVEFLRTYGDARFLLYIHYMDVHQYLYDETSALFGTTYSDAYDNSIRWVDRNIGVLVSELVERDLLRKTLLVIASDHGEAFFEHGREGHARDVYAEVVDVPLIFVFPFPLDANTVVEPLVQNVDIWPTLLDLLGLPAMPGAQGESLVPLIRRAVGGADSSIGEFEERAAFAQIDQTWARRNRDPRPLIGVQEGPYRLIHHVANPSADELYDRKSDHREQVNLAANYPELVVALRKRVGAYLDEAEADASAAEEVEMDELQLEQLRALGYVQRP
jgi:arylsulfatase A-like enzyme